MNNIYNCIYTVPNLENTLIGYKEKTLKFIY